MKLKTELDPVEFFIESYFDYLPFRLLEGRKPLKPYYTSKGKNATEILPLYCGFDIETTNDEATRSAYMYIATLAIATENACIIVHFRKWDYFTWFCRKLSEHFQLSDQRHIIIFIANAGYEFQFIRNRFEWSQDEFAFFAKEERQPLKATTSHHIEFREALSISGGGLAYLAKTYTTTQKAVGDLDYSIPRNSTTPLTETEMGYINNDVLILCEFAYYIFTVYLGPKRWFPMTKTSILRRDLKEHLQEAAGQLWQAYLDLVQSLFPNYNDYILFFNYLFRGGYVHSNIVHTNEEMENVASFDETSAYPAMMILYDNYPVTPFKFIDHSRFFWAIENKACIIDITFNDIRRKTAHSIESKSKALLLEEPMIDNGRVARASKMRVLLTEQDFLNYQDYYTCSSYKINSLRIADRGKLPKPWLDLLMKDYKYKNLLKSTGKKHTQEYEIYKERVNTYYGMSVTRISLDNWKYTTDGWVNKEKASIDYDKEVSKSFLSPFWGFWICANARRALLSCCMDIERACSVSGRVTNVVIYNDTDSIKCPDDPRIDQAISIYNNRIQTRKQELGLTDPDFETLGQFEKEAVYKRFKTLGAKRYLVEYYEGTKEYKEKGRYEITIAGLPKQAVKTLKDPFKSFSVDGMNIAALDTGKKAHIYNDGPSVAYINGEEMHELSSVYLGPASFSLKLDPEYYLYLVELFKERKVL